tara:strand:+ start:354 stop:632 length:279 start_codon:yes stop_codon:yes gene_type:complete
MNKLFIAFAFLLSFNCMAGNEIHVESNDFCSSLKADSKIQQGLLFALATLGKEYTLASEAISNSIKDRYLSKTEKEDICKLIHQEKLNRTTK